MSDNFEMQQAAQELAQAFAEYKDSNDTRLSSLERKGSVDVVVSDKLRRLDTDMTRLQDTVTQLRTAQLRPASGVALSGVTLGEPASQHKQAFLRYLSKGNDSELQDWQTKDMSVGSDPDGGYLLPQDMAQQIVTRQFDTTPMRQIANIMTINSDAVEMLRDIDEPEAQWLNEVDTRADTNSPQLGRIRITAHELHAQPRATQKLLDDSSINVEEWITAKIAERFARRENEAFVKGDGVAQPRGFTSYATAATADASRAWGVLEHVNTGSNGAFDTGTGKNGAEKLIELMFKLKAGYLPKATWLMPRALVQEIRSFKEASSNAYIWQPGLNAGQPATLLGFPLILAEDMPAKASGSLSVAFGNFAEGYTIVDRLGLRMLRDPYTAAPFVKFRASKRVGGDVTNFDAIKLLRFSA